MSSLLSRPVAPAPVTPLRSMLFIPADSERKLASARPAVPTP